MGFERETNKQTMAMKHLREGIMRELEDRYQKRWNYFYKRKGVGGEWSSWRNLFRPWGDYDRSNYNNAYIDWMNSSRSYCVWDDDLWLEECMEVEGNWWSDHEQDEYYSKYSLEEYISDFGIQKALNNIEAAGLEEIVQEELNWSSELVDRNTFITTDLIVQQIVEWIVMGPIVDDKGKCRAGGAYGLYCEIAEKHIKFIELTIQLRNKIWQMKTKQRFICRIIAPPNVLDKKGGIEYVKGQQRFKKLQCSHAQKPTQHARKIKRFLKIKKRKLKIKNHAT